MLLNGEPRGLFHPSRGIRQGDPLSSFLFHICIEGLHGLIRNATREGKIRGFSLCKRGPKLTHLFLQMIVYCFAKPTPMSAILFSISCLPMKVFQARKLTQAKQHSSLANPPQMILKKLLKVCLGCTKFSSISLPSLVGKGKKASFNYIKERVWKKLKGWEGRLLSQAGREVLIKFVIQAIPSFAMGCFRIPLGLCNNIEVMIKKFWWDERDNR